MKRAAGTAALLVMPVLVMLLGALLFYGIGNGLSPGAVALLLLAVVLAAVPLLVVAAQDDERFSLAHIKTTVAALDGPVELAVVEGTHMAFFTHSMAIDALLADWMAAH